ncbi:unnamed protein product [Vitrella brassicaformis CCMP3155]|uniref:Membrane insertase YidC/Oxa/ALB C-terminal domain-containing protein n=1 Tax=Vitrella brassicaformis (strain CCMP3155) TaxID=1169540 RepID=A0A0G4GLJ2_VITBC|nr:unnamed protein product [Vitrella brassicaformis CCMP3155]|eukprot:CEM30984.1 unnamed protein product [Vitrella brassicaformis CCMP3155]
MQRAGQGVAAASSVSPIAGIDVTGVPDVAVPDLEAELPIDSQAYLLLDRCREQAELAGVDPGAPYEPLLAFDMIQSYIYLIKESVGCPWWMAIVGSTVLLRLLLLPIHLAVLRDQRRKALFGPKLRMLEKAAQDPDLDDDESGRKQKVQKKLMDFRQKHKLSIIPTRFLSSLAVQFPLFYCFYQTMRGFAMHPDSFRSFAMENPFWLDSLSLSDPYGFMPLLLVATMLTNTELNNASEKQMANQMIDDADPTSQKLTDRINWMTWILRGGQLVFLWFMWNKPAGLFFYSLTNSTCSLLLSVSARHPFFEELFNLPPLKARLRAERDQIKQMVDPFKAQYMDELLEASSSHKDSGAADKKTPSLPLNGSAKGGSGQAVLQGGSGNIRALPLSVAAAAASKGGFVYDGGWGEREGEGVGGLTSGTVTATRQRGTPVVTKTHTDNGSGSGQVARRYSYVTKGTTGSGGTTSEGEEKGYAMKRRKIKV